MLLPEQSFIFQEPEPLGVISVKGEERWWLVHVAQERALNSFGEYYSLM